MKPLRLQLAIIIVCLVANTAAAQMQLLHTACATADAVVMGTIEPIVLTSKPATFVLTIDRVIKGALRADSALTVSWPGSLTSVRVGPNHYRALWFLRSAPSANWEISPIGGPNAPLFASGLAVPSARQTSLAQTPATNCLAAVWAVLKENAAYVDQSPIYLTAMETLLLEPPAAMAAELPDFAETLRGFAQSSSIDLRTLALASGIRRQDVQSLTQAAAQAATIAKSKMAHRVGIAMASWRGSDPAGLAALGAMAEVAGADYLSHPAAQALMMIHTKDAVPHLVGLLSSAEPHQRDAAVRGLSLFVRGAPILTAENVRAMAYFTEGRNGEYLDEAISPYVTITPVSPTTESEYVSAWSAWWNRMATKWTN